MSGYAGRLDLFQSTLSMRRATTDDVRFYRHTSISIHALHEESDKHDATWQRRKRISIHALHEESDPPLQDGLAKIVWEFQSTLSMRRATQTHDHSEAVRYISIHALHEESDDEG